MEKLIGFKEFDFSIEFLGSKNSYLVGKKNIDKLNISEKFQNFTPKSLLRIECILKSVE